MASVDVVETFRKESVNGIPASVLKSAIQKYARRGMLEQGNRVLGLLSYFNEQRLTTNVTNRLVVMMSEEVNIHETFLPVAMKQLHEEWTRTRSPVTWLRMYALLCRARKCRVVSDVKTRWNLPPYKGNLAHLDRLHDKLLRDNNASVSGAHGTIAEFRSRLTEGSYDAFDVLRVLLRGKQPDKTIWETLSQACATTRSDLVPVVSALRYFHKQMHHAERPIYIYHAILLVLNADALDEAPRPWTEPRDPTQEDLDRWRREGATLTIASFPDYVIDRHTSMARGQSAVVFAEVGALIPDEDKRFLNEEHRRLYMAFKRLQEEGTAH
jgi:hypothetical protein